MPPLPPRVLKRIYEMASKSCSRFSPADEPTQRELQPLDIVQAVTQYFPATSADNFMARTALMLPDCFAHWIDQHMPELRGGDTVTFLSCGRGEIPFDFFPGLSGMIAGRGGVYFLDKG